MFQQQIGEFLTQNQEMATKLIDTILIQLNWAFSEFVGMLQEVTLSAILIHFRDNVTTYSTLQMAVLPSSLRITSFAGGLRIVL